MRRWQLIDVVLKLRAWVDDHFWQYRGLRAEIKEKSREARASIQYWPPGE